MGRWEQYKLSENIEPSSNTSTNKWAKYMVTPPLGNINSQNTNSEAKIVGEEGDSWPALIGKSVLKGATSIADLPRLAEEAVAFPRNQLAEFFNLPSLKYKPVLPTTDDARAKIKEYTGVDLEPKPSTPGQRIASIGAEFGAPGGIFGAFSKAKKLANIAKQTGVGVGIGTGSGILQETGIDPLVADISATLVPYGITKGAQGIGNLGGKLISSPEESARRILKNKIGEKNLPQVIKNLGNNLPFNAPANTAELAQNTGISALHRAMSPNILAITEKQAIGDSILKNKLNSLSPYSGASYSRAGENIRNALSKNLNRAHEIRAAKTKSLYDKLYELDQGIKLPKTQEFLKTEKRFAKGDIKKNLDYIENLITSNKTSSDSAKFYDKVLKEYEGLSPSAKEKLINTIGTHPVPAELKGALTEINDKYKSAKRAGNDNLARIYSKVKDNILSDMSHIPEEQIARELYAKLSKPVSAIEKEPLLARFVKKDEFGKDFLLSPEKIPQMILRGSTNNIKALMKQASSNSKMLNTIRGSFVDEMLNKTSLSSINATGEHNLSYDKLNRFLKQNKEKLQLVFDENQIQVLNDARDLLKKRNMVQTLGRAAGSNTQSEMTLLSELTTIGAFGSKALKFIPGGKKIGQIAKPVYDALQNTQKQAIKDILAEALIDPQKAKLLLIPTRDIKSTIQLNTILARLAPIGNNYVDNMETNQ